MQKTDTTSHGSNNFAKQTFLRLGYNEEDVHTVFQNETGYIPFTEVREKLEKLKEKRKNYNFDDIELADAKQTMIVVSSEPDTSEDDDNYELHSHQPRYNYAGTRHSNIFEHKLNRFSCDENESNALKFAKLDMPQHDDLLKWFTSNFRPVYEGVVLKDDMFKRFCDHFHAPPYLTLQELFFEEIDRILKTDIELKNAGIECVEDQYFEGLEIYENAEESLTSRLKKELRIDERVSKIPGSLNQIPGSLKQKHVPETMSPSFYDPFLKPVPKKIDESSKIQLAAKFNNVKKSDDGNGFGAYLPRIQDIKFYDSPSTAGPHLKTKAETPASSYKYDHFGTNDSNSTVTPQLKTVIERPSTSTVSRDFKVIDPSTNAEVHLKTKAETPASSYRHAQYGTNVSNSTASPLLKTVIERPSTSTVSRNVKIIDPSTNAEVHLKTKAETPASSYRYGQYRINGSNSTASPLLKTVIERPSASTISRNFKLIDPSTKAVVHLETKAETPASSYRYGQYGTNGSSSTASPLLKTVIERPSASTVSGSVSVIDGKQKETNSPFTKPKRSVTKAMPALTRSNKTVDDKPNTNKTARSRKKSPTASSEKKVTVKENTPSPNHLHQVKELLPKNKSDYVVTHYQIPPPKALSVPVALGEGASLETDKLNLKKASNKELLNLPNTSGSPNLRPIIIDGSNVAREHGNGSLFSCRGIALCVRYFWFRGHREITCFVPNFRKGPSGNPRTIDNDVLFDLEKKNICKFTPSRKINGKLVVSYDDRFILTLAESNKGVIVSNDQYRDLLYESREFKKIIETRLLPFVFVDHLFMPAPDPLGRNGPNLDDFLKLPVNSRSNRKKQQNPTVPPLVDISARNGSTVCVKRTNFQPSERQDAYSNDSLARVDAIIKSYPASVSQTSASFAKPVPKTRQKKLQKEVDRNANTSSVGSPTYSTSSSESEPTDEEQWNRTRKQLIALFPDKQLEIDTLHALQPAVLDLNVLADLLLQDDEDTGAYI